MKIQDLKLKKLKLITNYDVIKEIVQNVFDSKDMIDYMYKNYYYFKIDNNRFLEIRKYSSFEISNIIVYNEERDTEPQKTLNNFINQQIWDFKGFNENDKNYYMIFQTNSNIPHIWGLSILNSNSNYGYAYQNYDLHRKNNFKMELLNYNWCNCRLVEKKDINSDLIDDITAILTFDKYKMLERLEKYYNKYIDKIYVHSYMDY